jgi:hypothetical protein
MISETLKRKVDARSRFQLANGTLTGEVEAFVKVIAPMTPAQEQEMADAGMQPYSIRGTIVAGAIVDAAHLETVARLPFVHRIELSRPLFDDPTS